MKKSYLIGPFIAILIISLMAGSVLAAGIELDKQISTDGGETWEDADSEETGPIVTEGDSILFQYILTNTNTEDEGSLTYDLNDSILGLLVDDGVLGAGETTVIELDSNSNPYSHTAEAGNNPYETHAEVDAVAEDGTTYEAIDYAYYYSIIAAQTVEIDIKPGSDPNSINLKSRGVVPLALLSSEDFDATSIFGGETDPSIYFAGSGGEDVRWAIEDVNDDGLLDVIFHFKTQEITELNDESTEGEFSISYGEDPEDNPIISYTATDEVNMVPKGNGSSNSNNGNGNSNNNGNNGNHGTGNNGNGNGNNK